MKIITKLLLSVLTLGFVAGCSSIFGGDEDLSKDPSFVQLRNANVNFIEAKRWAQKISKPYDKSIDAKADAEIEAVNNSNNPAQLQENRGSNDDIAGSLKDAAQNSAIAKQNFEKSAGYFFKGIASETALVASVTKRVQDLKAQIEKASPMEKMSLTKQISPLTAILDLAQNDLKNMATTSKLYIDYATKNGIDIKSIQNNADKEALQKANEITAANK